LFAGRAQDAQGRPVAAGGKGPGITVGHYQGFFGKKRLPPMADAAVCFDILAVYSPGLLEEHFPRKPFAPGFLPHTLEGPEEVNRRGPCPAQPRKGLFQLFGALGLSED